MARLNIDTGTEGNSATGDTLRTAMTKINTNFSELYIDLAATTSSNGNLTNSVTNGDVKIFANGTGIVEIDRLSLNNTTISSLDTNADITLTANGTGSIAVSGPLKVGTGSAAGGITSNGAQDIKIDTNSGTDSGYIEIKDGANGDITIENDGNGDILLKVGGQVGIGDVSAPDTSLHIKQLNAILTLQRTNDANTPGINFQSNGGNVRAKIFMDGTGGTNKEIVFQNMDGSMAEKFRVTLGGAKVTGVLNVDDGISITDNKITTSASNANLELGTSGTGTVELQADTNVTGDLTTSAISLVDNKISASRSNDDLNLAAAGTGDINLTSASDINIPTAVGLTFGSDTEKIENTSGNNLYLYAATNIYLNAENDLHFDANGGDIVLKDNNTKFGQFSNLGGKLTIYSGSASNAEITLGGAVLCENVSIKFTSLPTSDPGVAGRLWRSGTDLKISIG